MRKTPQITITEHPGNQFADLATVQLAGESRLADSLESVIRDLLERGVLVMVEGKIMPNPKRSSDE